MGCNRTTSFGPMTALTAANREAVVVTISRRRILRGVASGFASVVVGMSLLKARVAEAEVVAWKFFRNPSANFTTSSTSYVASSLPTNPSFTKQYDSTYLWIVCNIDLTTSVDTSAFQAVMLDGTTDIFSVAIAAFANSLVVVSMSDIVGGIAAGTHTFPIYVAINSGTGTWRMPVASYKILEVNLPPSQ
jgi:hypothetical protein